MNSAELRAVQAPLKARYREHPEDATVTLRARARLDDTAIARKRNAAIEAYRDMLRQRADISINPDVVTGART